MSTVIYLGSPVGFESAKAVLGENHTAIHVKPELQDFNKVVHQASAVLDASMKLSISKEMVEHAPKLIVISCATTGSDHIDLEGLAELGIQVRTLKEEPELLKNLTPAAELSWALLMACARGLKGALKHVEEGRWIREEFPGVMLRGRMLGLIGCGRIGGWMARYANAFGMNVIAYDPYQEKFPENVEPTSLQDVMRRSDFVSVHVHLSADTRNLVSRDLLESCKPGLILINTSRGAIVDEQALLDGLDAGRIGACGVDVLDGEPDIASHPLVTYAKTHDNLLITPHCGGFSPDAVRLVCAKAAEKILAVL